MDSGPAEILWTPKTGGNVIPIGTKVKATAPQIHDPHTYKEQEFVVVDPNGVWLKDGCVLLEYCRTRKPEFLEWPERECKIIEE